MSCNNRIVCTTRAPSLDLKRAPPNQPAVRGTTLHCPPTNFTLPSRLPTWSSPHASNLALSLALFSVSYLCHSLDLYRFSLRTLTTFVATLPFCCRLTLTLRTRIRPSTPYIRDPFLSYFTIVLAYAHYRVFPITGLSIRCNPGSIGQHAKVHLGPTGPGCYPTGPGRRHPQHQGIQSVHAKF